MSKPEQKATQISIQEAQANLPELVERASEGDSIVIARAGKPLAKVVGLKRAPRRIGFMKGEMLVPDDFDDMGADQISKMFAGQE